MSGRRKPAGPRGLSLHIGVNFVDPEHYGGDWDGRLVACENDCDVMQAIALAQGFETSVLKSAAATRDAIGNAIRQAAAQLEAGDFFLLTYSGHGGTVPDVDGDEKDLVDETWCLYDGQMLDDELAVLWACFRPGVRVLLVSDSCHSGTLLKGPGTGSRSDLADSAGSDRPRAMPRDIARDTARRNREFYANLQYTLPDPRPDVAATVRLLSGCREDELSWEGNGNGRFTEALQATFADGRFDGDYRAFHRAILEKIKKRQRPNHAVLGKPNKAYDRERPFSI